MPDPVLLLPVGEFVEVEDGLPLRVGLAVLVEGGAPPQAALVLLVAPEVVIVTTVFADVRDFLFGIHDCEQALSNRLEVG